MAALAAFAASPQGAAFAALCDRWGTDPAASLDDDVLAHNLRYALAVATRDDSDDRADKLSADLERIEQVRREFGG